MQCQRARTDTRSLCLAAASSSLRIDDGYDEHTHAPLEEIETLDTELGLALEMAFLVIEVGRGDELLAAELSTCSLACSTSRVLRSC